MRRLILGLAVSLTLSACGASKSSAFLESTASNAPSAAQPAAGGGLDAKVFNLGPATVEGVLGSEPVVKVDTSVAPATALGILDIAVGDGATVKANSTVTAHYVGYGAATGQKFDASWTRGQPATFPLANVIVGWQDGLQGMKVGGRRLLVIPADHGYGDTPPSGSGIQPGETLIFVVDLVGVQ